MSDQSETNPLAVAVQQASDEYAAMIDALTALLRGAHHLSMTSRGQDLRPITLAAARMGMALFPADSPMYAIAQGMREQVTREVVPVATKDRS